MAFGPLLIVEDSDEDYYTMTRALGHDLPCEVVRCSTGTEALDYLFRRGVYHNASLPSLTLLDLNLPSPDGRRILGEIKQHMALCVIPVIIVSTSANPSDILHCYRAGASGYIVKTIAYDQFAPALRIVRAYWYSAVALPTL